MLPAIWQAFEAGIKPVQIQARLESSVTGIQAKTQYRRGVIGVRGTEVVAQLKGAAGSHLLAQAVGSNALLEIPPLARLQPNQTVTAHLFADTNWDAHIEPTRAVPAQPAKPHMADSHHLEDRRALVIFASVQLPESILTTPVHNLSRGCKLRGTRHRKRLSWQTMPWQPPWNTSWLVTTARCQTS